jgi:hypothetical protein
MHKWFRLAALLASLLVVSSVASAQSDDDRESAKALRSAADSMSQLGQIGEGSDASCAKEFSVYLYCQASKLETGSKNVCAKPKCSFGNSALAELLNVVEEEDKAAAAQAEPSPAKAASEDSAGQSDSPILNAGNQQAAAIRATGDANAAKQEATAQQRAAGQNAGRQAGAKSSSGQGAATQSGGGLLPTGATAAPLTVVFNHTTNWSQGNAHVVSTPAGIDCPTTCSASFAAGLDVVLQATADSNSIVKNVDCYAWTGGGTSPRTRGDSMSCVWPGLFVVKGGKAVVYVDAADSNQQTMITGNGLPPVANGTNSGSSTNGSAGGGTGNSGKGGTASANGGGNGTSGGNSGAYLEPITLNCVREFWDPKFYNWLSFENDCGQAIHLMWIARSSNDHFGASSADIGAGHSANTGWSKSEVAAKGDFAFFVCPLGSIAVDSNTGQSVNNPGATYRCKKQ